jgi:hypothetical protein
VSTRNLVEISLSGLDDEATQAVASLFDRWGRGGVVIEQILDGETGAGTRSTVKTYLLAEDDDALCQIEIGLALLRQARHVFPSQDFAPPEDFAPCGDCAPLPEPRMRFLAETDWAEAWKASCDVLPVGRRLVVKPTWRDYTPQPDDLVIELDPGMAFGSGLHPTTRLCLEAMEDHLRPGATLLDVGTGSGILAIAAARLGASRVLALDTDPLAVRIARENVILNGVEAVVEVEMGTVQMSNVKSQIPNIKYQISNQGIRESGNRGIGESGNQGISELVGRRITSPPPPPPPPPHFGRDHRRVGAGVGGEPGAEGHPHRQWDHRRPGERRRCQPAEKWAVARRAAG